MNRKDFGATASKASKGKLIQGSLDDFIKKCFAVVVDTSRTIYPFLFKCREFVK